MVLLQRSVFLCMMLLHSLLYCEANTPENNIGHGMPLFEGDILLSPQQLNELQQQGGHVRQRRAVVMGEMKWPNGTVPYELSNLLNESAVGSILASMDEIMRDTESKIEFRSRQAGDQDYLHITPGNTCSSFVGRKGGRQTLSIGRGCEGRGVVIHELVHALGRWHEQSRRDRDQYVTIHEENIQKDFLGNFKVQLETTTQGLPYDYDSVMHYDAYAFSSNNQPTITPVDTNVPPSRLGQRDGLSETDRRHLRILYPKSQWSAWSSWGACSASCGSGLQRRVRECLGDAGVPCLGSDRQDRPCHKEECPTDVGIKWGAWSQWSGCSRSCGRGSRVRIRSCIATSDLCEGVSMQEDRQDCNTHIACPAEFYWSEWSRWSLCSQRCQGGTRYRTRSCVKKSADEVSEVLADSGGQSCSGESLQTMSCFSDVSCGAGSSCVGSSCSDKSGSQSIFYNNTCLAGLTRVGCHRLSPVTITSIQSSDRQTVLDDMTSQVESLKSCGRYALMKNLAFFGLSGSQCYCSPNVSDFLQGGALEVCEEGCTDCVDVYQISGQENFELSVKAFESCGPGFCERTGEEGEGGRELFCSGSRRTAAWSLLAIVTWTLLMSFMFY